MIVFRSTLEAFVIRDCAGAHSECVCTDRGRKLCVDVASLTRSQQAWCAQTEVKVASLHFDSDIRYTALNHLASRKPLRLAPCYNPCH